MPVVCDASVLISLHAVACLPLLDRYDEVLVPLAVWREIASKQDGVAEAASSVGPSAKTDERRPRPGAVT